MNIMYDVGNDVTHDVDHNARDVICEIHFPYLFYCVFHLCCRCKPNILLIWCWLDISLCHMTYEVQ